MKKSFWLLGMAVAALTSCTQNELVEVSEGRLIKFDTYVEKGSRAGEDVVADDHTSLYGVKDLAASNITNFWVYGDRYACTDGAIGAFKENVFNNHPVSKSGNDWTYTGIKYWQSDMIYRFAAYSNSNAALGDGATSAYVSKPTDGSADYLQITGYTSDGEKDLVASIVNDRNTTSSFNSIIQFPFSHMLTKVIVNVFSDYDLVGSHLRIEGLTLEDVYKKGDCKYVFSNASAITVLPEWTNLSEHGDYTGMKTVVASGGTPEDNFFVSSKVRTFVFYVIPQSFGTKNEETGAVTVNSTAPKLSFVAKSYSSEYTEAEILAGKKGDKTIDYIHKYNESFSLNPCVTGGSAAPIWAGGHIYIYNVEYKQASTEETPIKFGAPTVSGWGTVMTGGLQLGPTQDPVVEQNANN